MKEMIAKDYAKAYKEVVTILSCVPEEDLQKIPKEKIDFYINNMDKNYKYKIDEDKEFEEQEMSEITKAVLANIFKDYWATPYQKERIEAKEKYDLERLEEEKREKYNPDNIFKKKENVEEKVETIVENLPMVAKENIFIRVWNFIKNIFKSK